MNNLWDEAITLKQKMSPEEWEAFISIPEAKNIRLNDECVVISNGNYKIVILKDGTKIRFSTENSLIPDYPECIDLTISKKCNYGCPYCYMGCTPNGESMEDNEYTFTELRDLLHDLPKGTEVAINVNDATSHDAKAVVYMCWQLGLFCNITINIEELKNDKSFDVIKDWQDSDMIQGIGVSIPNNYTTQEMERIKQLKNVVLHFVLGVNTINEYAVIRSIIPDVKVLLLGYKRLGRGETYPLYREGSVELWKKCVISGGYRERYSYHDIKMVLDSIEPLGPKPEGPSADGFWFWGYHDYQFNSLALDGLAIEQLGINKSMPQYFDTPYYAGEEGAYTFYMDMIDHVYARSSIDNEMFPMGTKSIKEMFQSVRTSPISKKGK